MKLNAILFFLITTILSYSQDIHFDYPHFKGKTLIEIQENSDWSIIKKASGDLNGDTIDDLAIVIEYKNKVFETRCDECRLKQKPRIILVLLNSVNIHKVIIQNNVFIAREDEGGMLPQISPELSITDKLLTIYYQYTRGNQSYTFKFNKDKMKVLKASSFGVHNNAGDFEGREFDFFKNELKVETGNISDEVFKTKIYKFKIQPKSLSEFGKMYDWKIVENYYL